MLCILVIQWVIASVVLLVVIDPVSVCIVEESFRVE